jgi:hypothetical protein
MPDASKKENNLPTSKCKEKLKIQPLTIPIEHIISCEVFCWSKNTDLQYFSAVLTINNLNFVFKPTLYKEKADIKRLLLHYLQDSFEINLFRSETYVHFAFQQTNKALMSNYGYKFSKNKTTQANERKTESSCEEAKEILVTAVS